MGEGHAPLDTKNIEKLRFFKLLRTITIRSEVEKNRIADVFKWSKGFDRYFNAANNIFNFSSFFQRFGGPGPYRLYIGAWPGGSGPPK